MKNGHLLLLVSDDYPQLEVRTPDGEEPTHEAHRAAMVAFRAANEATGAVGYSDGTRLDMEECANAASDIDRAVGIVVRALLADGFSLTVVQSHRPYDGS